MSQAAAVLGNTIDRDAMSEAPDMVGSSQRPYHHGDLSRALVLAGRRILENQGPAALSLRAVAREAGVSPAAPYHHFKDKGELLDAVAKEGWRELGEAIARVREAASSAPCRHHRDRRGLRVLRPPTSRALSDHVRLSL